MQHPVKKKTRRKLRKGWLMLAAAVGLSAALALVLLLPAIRQRHPAQSIPVHESTFRTLEILEPAQVESVTIHPVGGDAYTLRMQNGVLMLEREGALADISDLYAQEILSAVTQIVAQAVVAEDAAEVELAQMGLEPPQATAAVRCTDGTQSVLKLGGSVPNTTYSYCQWNGSTAVYMCDSGVADALSLTANQLLPVSQPEVYSALVKRLRIENAAGSFEMVFGDGAYGMLTQPYVYPLDAEASSAILTALQNMRLGTREGDVTAENRAAYGFDQPLCVLSIDQTAGRYSRIAESGQLVTQSLPAQSLRFVIGRAEGDFFYTCEYEGSCYFISRFLVEALVNASADALASRHPANLGDLPLNCIRMEASGKTAEMCVAYTERVLPNNELETDENGGPVYNAAVTLNGAQSSQEQLDELQSRLAEMTVSGNAPQSFEAQAPCWRVEITAQNGLVRVLEGYRLDLFTDVLFVDGTARHTIAADAIDILTEGYLP